jgi:cytoplasmic tRNA 2-thiolation protein 1
MAKLVPGSDEGCGGACSSSAVPAGEDEEAGCGSSAAQNPAGEMESMEKRLAENEVAKDKGLEVEITSASAVPARTNKKGKRYKTNQATGRKAPAKQVMGQCKICGYLSSQEVCKACVLLEGLNKSRPKNEIEVGYEAIEEKSVEGITLGIKETSIQTD